MSSFDSNIFQSLSNGYADRTKIAEPENKTTEWSGTCKICGEHLSFRLLGSEDRRRKTTKFNLIEIGGLLALLIFGFIVYSLMNSSEELRNLSFTRWLFFIIFGAVAIGMIRDVFERSKSHSIIVEKKNKDSRHNLIHELVLDGITPEE
jgi:hypothetical protein